MKNIFTRIKNWYQNLPDKKKYIELISAALTVPMLLTVIIINLNNIKNQNQTTTTDTSSSTTPIQIVITGTQDQENKNPPPTEKSSPTATGSITPTSTPTSTPTPTSCINEIGPIEILSPQEGEIISTSNVCLNISTDSKYCQLVWSYKLDDDDWSEFNSNDICFYNLDSGSKQLQIKFKNTSTGNTVTLVRNFTYQNPSITSTPTVTLTNSPTPTP
ncbi:MAG: hypothetical protein EOM23_03350 [Candidatus Moranbacteria bacterium]|nr:hypothetical protein [Candidatus Moranbacteria bacterium]